MKTVLTIAVCETPQEQRQFPRYDGVELYIIDQSQTAAQFLRGIAKSVKSKYVLIADGDFTFADMQAFLLYAEKSKGDILTFPGGYCLKSRLLRALPAKNIGNRYFTEIHAAMGAKTVDRSEICPLRFHGMNTAYSEAGQKDLAEAIGQFNAGRSRLPKPVYAFLFDAVCARLATFYMSAMLSIRNGEIPADRLIGFDRALKQNVILYLALNKRFRAADLTKLRRKDFRISLFTANKFKKMLKD